MDFTLRKYAQLCAALLDHGYRSLSVGAYIEECPAHDERLVLLRHDVDRHPRHALKMGEIEKEYGLTATYFFRTVKSAFDPDAIRAMHGLGHEIGYHYETLAQTRGDITRAIDLFGQELARLRGLAPVRVAGMHGSPLSRCDNRAIWEWVTPQAFDLVGEVYRDIDYHRVVYLNDTGRSWNPTRYNLRDLTDEAPPFSAETTDDVIALLGDERIRHLCLLTHPERWQDGAMAWVRQLVWDVATNGIKVLLRRRYAEKK